MIVKVGTRGSKLALAQTDWVIMQLQTQNPSFVFEKIIIRTKGDKIQDIRLDKIGDKGLFVKEIEEALLNKDIDLAVHSLKDMPSTMAKGLMLAPIPKREDPSDTLITPHRITDIHGLPPHAVIGTGSKRREVQLLKKRPDLQIEGIRGNIDTRIHKMLEQHLDGIILATAGLNRLGIKDNDQYHLIRLETNWMVPAPAQGALGLQIRSEDRSLSQELNKIQDKIGNINVAAERAFLEAIGGSCHVPVGAHCVQEDNLLTIQALYGNQAGDSVVMGTVSGIKEEPERLGRELAVHLKRQVEVDEG